MSDEIVPQAFTSEEFGTIRTMVQDGSPLFCAKDVAVALGYQNTNDAIKKHCKGVAICYPLQTAGGTQNVRFITEGDMYRLIASSKLESAQRFESWVFDEVIPSIRRDGAYVASDGTEDDATLMARALLAAKRAIDRKDRRIAELEPKALFADAVSASDGTCLIGELAKMMTQAGYPIGQNRLFAKLREDGYLGKSGSNRNVPLQRYVEMGLFKIKETAITHSDGHVTISRTTKVTGKGQRYFMERYCMVVA